MCFCSHFLIKTVIQPAPSKSPQIKKLYKIKTLFYALHITRTILYSKCDVSQWTNMNKFKKWSPEKGTIKSNIWTAKQPKKARLLIGQKPIFVIRDRVGDRKQRCGKEIRYWGRSSETDPTSTWSNRKTARPPWGMRGRLTPVSTWRNYLCSASKCFHVQCLL